MGSRHRMRPDSMGRDPIQKCETILTLPIWDLTEGDGFQPSPIETLSTSTLFLTSSNYTVLFLAKV